MWFLRVKVGRKYGIKFVRWKSSFLRNFSNESRFSFGKIVVKNELKNREEDRTIFKFKNSISNGELWKWKYFFLDFFLRSISLYLLSIRMDIESNSLEFEKFLNLIFSKMKIRMKKFHSTFSIHSRTWNYIYTILQIITPLNPLKNLGK